MLSIPGCSCYFSNYIKVIQDWHSRAKPYKEFIVALDVVVDTAQVIVFGIGALKKDCLLTGMAPVKLSPLILGPIVSILAVGILRDELYWEMFLSVCIVIYFVLAF